MTPQINLIIAAERRADTRRAAPPRPTITGRRRVWPARV